MPRPKDPSLQRSATLWVLACFLLIGFLARLHTYNEPLENDLTEYAVVGHELLNGRKLYSDLFQQRPPAIYLTYALAEKAVGYGQQQAFFLGWMAFALTLLGIYRAGSMAGSGERGGLWAAAFWTFLSSDMLLQANQPNTEVFMNVCMVWLFVRLAERPPQPRQEWLAGGLLALGTLYKPYMVLLVTFVLFGKAVLHLKKNDGIQGAKFMGRSLGPCFMVWTICFGYFSFSGRAGIFSDILFTHNHYYAGNILENLWKGLRPALLFPDFTWVLLPLILLMAVGSFLGLGKERKSWVLLGAFIAGDYLVIACSGKFFPHYYQLWLPLLCVGGGWGAALISKRFGSFSKNLKFAPAFLGLGMILAYEAPNYCLNAEGWSYEKYGNWFIETRRLGERIGRVLGPDELLFFWGDTADVHFYSRKSPPTGVIITWTAFSGPLAPLLTDRMFEDLRRTKPDMVVFDDLKFHDFYRHFLNKYRIWKYFPENKRYLLMVARGGKLEKRLRLEH